MIIEVVCSVVSEWLTGDWSLGLVRGRYPLHEKSHCELEHHFLPQGSQDLCELCTHTYTQKGNSILRTPNNFWHQNNNLEWYWIFFYVIFIYQWMVNSSGEFRERQSVVLDCTCLDMSSPSARESWSLSSYIPGTSLPGHSSWYSQSIASIKNSQS